MAKPVSAAALQRLRSATGEEPFIVVAINWGLGISWYATRKNNFGYQPNVTVVGSIRNERHSDSTCNVGSCRLQFSDTDGFLKSILNNRIGEKAPAAVYLAFADVSVGDFIPLIVGETVGPVSWNEGTRTLELGIETKTQSHELGFSATREDFDDINPQAEGVPWPMIFGSCAHVPALHFRRRAEATLQCAIRLFTDPVYLLTPTSIRMVGNPFTFTDDDTVNILYVDDSSRFPQDTRIGILVDETVVFYGQFVDQNTFVIEESNAPKYQNIKLADRDNTDVDSDNYSVLWLQDEVPIVNHHCYFKTSIDTEWYNFCVKQIGTKCWFRTQFFDPVKKPYNHVLMDATREIEAVYGITKCGIRGDFATRFQQFIWTLNSRKTVAGGTPYGLLMSMLDDVINKAGVWWSATYDAPVRQWDPPDSDIYIASLNSLDSVKTVYGKRRVNVNGKTEYRFTPIPESYYQVLSAITLINRMQPTGIIFSPPLLEYKDQGWTDDVFVTATSEIGNNPVLIIKWLLENFTEIIPDGGSFALAAGHISTTMRANFALFDKRMALRVAQEIAFQARCCLLLDTRLCGIVYMPVQSSVVEVFNDSNIKIGSLELGWTETKDIVTKFIATYTETYRDMHHLAKVHEINIHQEERIIRSLVIDDTRKKSETKYYIFYGNVDFFDLKIREEPAYIYNDVDAVAVFANFWGFRFGNVWRLASYQTWLQGIRLQPFDIVSLQLTDQTLLNSSAMPALIDAVEFDPKDKVTTIKVWLPVRIGDLIISPQFWPG